MTPEFGSADAIANDLLRVTRPGPVIGWTERIADIATQLNIDLARVNWHESPYNVAQQLVRICASRENTRRLMDVLHPSFVSQRVVKLPLIIEKSDGILKILFYNTLEIHKGQYVQFEFDKNGKIKSVTTARLPNDHV